MFSFMVIWFLVQEDAYMFGLESSLVELCSLQQGMKDTVRMAKPPRGCRSFQKTSSLIEA